ncbi:Aste57867_15234 [Aphanomyces stellatus]|uniref:nitric oxide dioxygenase n=1 Tax=Aphanomyces stellatus TaxID=120398 RepID=A0A485L2Q3_9STRA|nr:hypothetical protein As57867_015178 [Aphanomyces stellatus]VFT92043.1 Aste57867_15234 [Aphanomyces stellatus]
MGAAVSTKGSDAISVSEDGTIGLTHSFVAYFRDQVPPPFNLKRPTITRIHNAIIQDNWRAIVHGTSAFDAAAYATPTAFFTHTFYETLFVRSPALRSLFRSGMATQGKALAGTLETLVRILDSGDVVNTLQAIAERHLTYGVAKHHYVDFGLALLSALQVVSGDTWSPRVKRAYLNAYALCLYLMMPIIAGDDPRPMPESVPATITASVAMAKASSAKRLTLAVASFPLRYGPGDAVWLGLALPSGHVRRHFCITSFFDDDLDNPSTIEICIADVSASSHWLCTQPLGTTLDLFWIESTVRLDLDALPPHLVLVSQGAGCIPLITMLEGLYRMRDEWCGTVATLQCAPSLQDVEPFNEGVPTTGERIVWHQSTVYYALKATPKKLREIAGPHLDDTLVYVSGSNEFIASVVAAWTSVGGAPNRVRHYSLDNNHQFPLSAASLQALQLITPDNFQDPEDEWLEATSLQSKSQDEETTSRVASFTTTRPRGRLASLAGLMGSSERRMETIEIGKPKGG